MDNIQIVHGCLWVASYFLHARLSDVYIYYVEQLGILRQACYMCIIDLFCNNIATIKTFLYTAPVHTIKYILLFGHAHLQACKLKILFFGYTLQVTVSIVINASMIIVYVYILIVVLATNKEGCTSVGLDSLTVCFLFKLLCLTCELSSNGTVVSFNC